MHLYVKGLEPVDTPRQSWTSAERRRRIAIWDYEVFLIDQELAELSGGRRSFPPGIDAPDSLERTELLARRRTAMDELIRLHSPRFSAMAIACTAALAALVIVALMFTL